MKGGITSGVVYPEAVVELAKRYRFRGIGGTSAGAIAAAALAAAEYGRQCGGFERLALIPGELTGKVEGEPFIQSLFQPEPETRGLFESALAFQRNPFAGMGTLLVRFWRFPLTAILLAVFAVVLGWRGDVRWTVAAIVLGVAPWILVIGVVRDVIKAFGRVADNDFGLCRLGPRTDGRDALTVWLHKTIQKLAGRNEDAPPLTFADLWGVPRLPPDATVEDCLRRLRRLCVLSSSTRLRRIDLQVVTTNLSHGRPISLPLLHDRFTGDSSEGGLMFDEAELRRFFPDAVVDHMVQHEHPLDEDDTAIIGQRTSLRRFDFSAELPVVVAARLSLSFPVLISTVPLWKIRYGAKGRPHRLQRMTFSDGGISSNFPVHFFDSPLPTRPTFAINLTGFDDDERPDLYNPADCIRSPDEANARPAAESWKQPVTMFDFFIAIKDAMQNWRDNSQARMPGSRERVIHIKLASGEGGLNLAMDDDKIRRLVARGRHAGATLVTLFSGTPTGEPAMTKHWNDHRYARFRMYMASLERHLRDLRRAYRAKPDAASIPYPERIAEGLNRGPFRLKQGELELASRRLQKYLTRTRTSGVSLDRSAPRPKASLRNTPPL